MAEIRGREWPKMEGCSAHTNGPGRIDDREYPQTANFMTNPASESFQFSIGSENPPQSIKKTRQAHFARRTSTGGTVLPKSPSYVDPMEKARRAEADRRADYITCVQNFFFPLDGGIGVRSRARRGFCLCALCSRC